MYVHIESTFLTGCLCRNYTLSFQKIPDEAYSLEKLMYIIIMHVVLTGCYLQCGAVGETVASRPGLTTSHEEHGVGITVVLHKKRS